MRRCILGNFLILGIALLFESYGFCSSQNCLCDLNRHEKELLAPGKITQEQIKTVKNSLGKEEKRKEIRAMTDQMKKNLYQMTQGEKETTEAYVLRKQKIIEKIQQLMGNNNREKTIDCLYFPSKENIIFFLQNHSLTREIANKKIIHAVAGFFADKEKVPVGVDLGVALCFNKLNANLDFDTTTVKLIQISLACALKDCALTSAL